jgi:hypothetical protein
VTADKISCIWYAANEDLIREHAERSGLPTNRIGKIKRIIDPATAET